MIYGIQALVVSILLILAFLGNTRTFETIRSCCSLAGLSWNSCMTCWWVRFVLATMRKTLQLYIAVRYLVYVGRWHTRVSVTHVSVKFTLIALRVGLCVCVRVYVCRYSCQLSVAHGGRGLAALSWRVLSTCGIALFVITISPTARLLLSRSSRDAEPARAEPITGRRRATTTITDSVRRAPASCMTLWRTRCLCECKRWTTVTGSRRRRAEPANRWNRATSTAGSDDRRNSGSWISRDDAGCRRRRRSTGESQRVLSFTCFYILGALSVPLTHVTLPGLIT